MNKRSKPAAYCQAFVSSPLQHNKRQRKDDTSLNHSHMAEHVGKLSLQDARTQALKIQMFSQLTEGK